jgi:hypothetical protein
MTESKGFDASNIEILAMRILRNEYVEPPINELGDSEVPVQITVEESGYTGQKALRIVIHVRAFTKARDGAEDEPSIPFLRFSAEFIFELKDYEDWVTVNLEKKTIDIDPRMSATLRGIAYSTTRGLLYMQSFGSIMSGLTLGVVDPQRLEKE